MHAKIQVTLNRASQRSDKIKKRKCEHLIQSACETTSDVKMSFPAGTFSAQSAKTIIFSTDQDGNAPSQHDGFEAILGIETYLAQDVGKIRPSKLCFLVWRGAHFHKLRKTFEEQMCQEA